MAGKTSLNRIGAPLGQVIVGTRNQLCPCARCVGWLTHYLAGFEVEGPSVSTQRRLLRPQGIPGVLRVLRQVAWQLSRAPGRDFSSAQDVPA
jgi:hypothetical protein